RRHSVVQRVLKRKRGGNMTKELRKMSYNQLVEYLVQVNKEIGRRAYGEGYRQGKFDAEMDRVAEVANEQTKETSQQARDRIVEQAKKDVVVITSNMKSISIKWEGNSSYRNLLTFPEFIVNKEKRTVAVLVRRYFNRSNI